MHVADHLLGGCGLHAGGTGDDLGADLDDDGVVGDLGERGAGVACDGGGDGSAGAGVLHRADDVGSAAGGGDADDDVLAGGTAAGDVALAKLGGIFVDVGGGGEGLGAAGHDVLHLGGQGGVGGGTLGCVERGDAAAGACADVDEAAAIAQRAGDDVDDYGDLGKGLADGGGDLGVFVVDDAGDLQRRLGIEALGRDVGGFGGGVVGALHDLHVRFGRVRLFHHGECCHRLLPPWCELDVTWMVEYQTRYEMRRSFHYLLYG